jgi:hypothetical protein
VKKPSKLGNIPSHPLDFKNRPYNLDSLIISYAGKEGILPQYLKSMVWVETSFHPSYRYEPFDDMLRLQQKDKITGKFQYESMTPYRILSATDKGTPDIPTDHSNIWDATPKITSYPGYQTIWDYYWEHISWYGLSRGYIGDGKEDYWTNARKTIRKKIFGDKAENELSTSEEQILSDSTDSDFFRWIRYEKNGGMEKMIAQTRIMASYGLLQLVYYYADTGVYPKNSNQYRPEDINDHSIGFGSGVKHFKKKLNSPKVLNGHFDDSTWQNGFEKNYFEALKQYNKNDKYRDSVMTRLPGVLPQK